jgi:serine/threonine-protein kinase HipA
MYEFMESSASAGGARAKAIVGFNPNSLEMTNGTKDDLPEGFEHWLIKFDEEKEGRSLDYTKLEYVYMSMAKDAGIMIPEIQLFEHGNLRHFLIKRFDRVDNMRMHMHTLAGLTHTDFNIPKHYSYDMLLKITLNLTGEQSAVEEQFRRMVFNVIARNQDDHAKNFSFMMNKKGVWSVTPAYDITYANGVEYTKNHQLSIRGKVNDFTLEDLLYIAKESSIKESWAKKTIQHIIQTVSSFEKRAEMLNIDKKHISRIVKALRLSIE